MLLLLVAIAAAAAGEPSLLNPSEVRAFEASNGPLDALVSYTIDQAIDDVSGEFTGHATIRWTNPSGAPVTQLPLHLHPNGPAELGITAVPRMAIDALTGDRKLAWTSDSPARVTVAFAEPVPVGGVAVLTVDYHGRMDAIDARANDPFDAALASMGSMGGMPGADYGLVAHGDGLFVLASAYPMVAPWRDGEFDASGAVRIGDVAYNGVARYDVRTVVPAGVAIVTNLVDEAPSTAAGKDTVRSKGDVVRDLVIVGGRDLAHSSQKVGDVTVRSWYRPRDADAGKRALDAAVAALPSYTSRFGPYPYSELDVAEATLQGGAGGVEFCGMVLVAGMLYRDPAVSQSQLAELMKMWTVLGGSLNDATGDTTAPVDSGSAKMLDDVLGFTVAHEVAHQWFAGIVGNDSHRSPTLDEPLAQYAAVLATEDRYGKDAAQRVLDRQVKLNYALWRALGGPDSAVRRDTSTYTSNAEYGALVYGKAPFLWFSLRSSLGDDALNRALRGAIDTWRFKIATTDAFIDAVDRSAGGGVRKLATRYLDEVHGDEDLAVPAPGGFVLQAILPPEKYVALDQTLPSIGLDRDAFVKMMFGGGIVSDAPSGPSLDPDAALRALPPR